MDKDIITFLKKYLEKLKDNTRVITQSDKLIIASIDEGVVMVLALWSGISISNCLSACEELYNLNYIGQIYIIDKDCMDKEFQENNFGEQLHGNGEIFIVTQGQINQRFNTNNNLENFKSYIKTGLI